MSFESVLRRRAPVLLADDGDRFLWEPPTIHACTADHWLLYFIAYPGDRDHEGIDWELVMVRENEQGELAEAVFAQHRGAQRRPGDRLRMDGPHPVVFVGRDKHSSRFRSGWFRHGRHLERANGKRRLDAPVVIGCPVAVQGRRAYRDPDGWLAALKV